MRDNGTSTKLTTKSGAPIYIADKACSGCSCYLAFVFECGCGSVHSDVCVCCGGFVDKVHKPLPAAQRCNAGPVEHQHSKF